MVVKHYYLWSNSFDLFFIPLVTNINIPILLRKKKTYLLMNAHIWKKGLYPVHFYFTNIARLENLAQRDLFEWLLNTFVVTIEIFPKILSRFIFFLSQSPLCYYLFSNKHLYLHFACPSSSSFAANAFVIWLLDVLTGRTFFVFF